jgi:hypothetical protein
MSKGILQYLFKEEKKDFSSRNEKEDIFKY